MNRNSLIKVVFLASIVLFLHPQHVGATTFTRNLTQGTRGEDVRTLQKVLNLFPETRIANTGAGSPGKETTLFGAGTKKALIKFQNLHKKDILEPLGLKRAPGYAGTYTIRKLESFLPLIGITISPLLPLTEETAPVVDTTPVITSLSISTLTPLIAGEPTKTSLGEYVFDNTNVIILTGKNFTKSNDIIFSSEPVIPGVISSNGTSLTFTFSSAMISEIAKSIAPLPSTVRPIIVNNLVSKQLENYTDPLLPPNWYSRISINIRNENGTSSPIFAVVNLAKGL